jgi:hypothetical protein
MQTGSDVDLPAEMHARYSTKIKQMRLHLLQQAATDGRVEARLHLKILSIILAILRERFVGQR